MEKPTASSSMQFRTETQVLNCGEDLSFDQAIAQQSKNAISSDERKAELDDLTNGFLQGVASSLATVTLRNENVIQQLPLILRAIVSDDNYRKMIESAVKFTLNVGPATDLVMKPVRFFVLENGERVATILPGQV